MSLEDIFFTLQVSERRWRGEGPQRQLERIPLPDVTAAVDQHPAFVLLGPPGSGKSTLLHRLALDTARDFLTGRAARLPFLLTLADYRWQQQTPLDFIGRRWGSLAAGDFVELARSGHMVLLADGLNEMLRLDNLGDRQRRANDWQRFLERYFADPQSSSRAVIASRDQADYEQSLELPRVEIDPLTADQIGQFLRAYLGDEAEQALAAITHLGLLDQARIPYPLSILARLYTPGRGDLPPNRGHLLAQYARQLLLGERNAGHAWFQPEAALAALAELGYALQQRGESTVLPKARLLALLPERVALGEGDQAQSHTTPPEAVFTLAQRAGLLAGDPTAAAAGACKFSHQLLQEHFSAAALLRRWQLGEAVAGLWRSPRRQREMPPPGAKPEGGEWDPAPPPPATGWEQTTLMAAGMAGRADEFVRAVLAANPALAGRCLSEGAAPVTAETRVEVQRALLADLGDPGLHFRTRVQAGRVLGAAGDPRFRPQLIKGAAVILPDLIFIPGGRAVIGSRRWPLDRQADDDERPQHRLDLAPFYLARYPVTHAEYACFIEAGGYERAAYWTPAGWQWRRGELEMSGPVEDLLARRRYYLENSAEIEKQFKAGLITPDMRSALQALIEMSEAEARQRLLDLYPVQPHERPYYWHDPAYNAPNQPLVGVAWYEAMAYCAWLAEKMAEMAQGQRGAEAPAAMWSDIGSGRLILRLPTEVEWEWAAGGPQHTTYPWGHKFDPDKANTLEGRLLTPAPCGAYPAGATAWGALDLSGNVWEWTHSLYRPYPYQPADGREDPSAGGRRVVRGGSYFEAARSARVSSRSRGVPDGFNDDSGFRVVVAPVLA